MKNILLLLIFTSCEKSTKEYYNNGSISKEYFLNKKGSLTGMYKEYYDDCQLKKTCKYNDGVLVDTSLYFTKKGYLESKIIWLDDSHGFKENYINNQVVSHGEILKPNYRINNWQFKTKDNLDSIVEYKLINNKSYVNQFWIIKKDTFFQKSNYYKIFINDTISLGETGRLRIYLESPFINKNSDIEIVIPYKDSELNDDYSNIDLIDKDTFFSLKNDKIKHIDVPRYINKNHTVEFGLNYGSIGKKRIRGIIIEYSRGLINTKNDTIDRVERRLYFEKYMYVKPDDGTNR